MLKLETDTPYFALTTGLAGIGTLALFALAGLYYLYVDDSDFFAFARTLRAQMHSYDYFVENSEDLVSALSMIVLPGAAMNATHIFNVTDHGLLHTARGMTSTAISENLESYFDKHNVQWPPDPLPLFFTAGNFTIPVDEQALIDGACESKDSSYTIPVVVVSTSDSAVAAYGKEDFEEPLESWKNENVSCSALILTLATGTRVSVKEANAFCPNGKGVLLQSHEPRIVMDFRNNQLNTTVFSAGRSLPYPLSNSSRPVLAFTPDPLLITSGVEEPEITYPSPRTALLFLCLGFALIVVWLILNLKSTRLRKRAKGSLLSRLTWILSGVGRDEDSESEHTEP